jgi:hypothetical protein
MASFYETFGSVAARWPLSYAVRDFFDNGGTDAIVVRIYGSPQRVVEIQAGGEIFAPKRVDPGEVIALPAAPADAPSGCATAALSGFPPAAIPPNPTADGAILRLSAANPGAWGNHLSVAIDQDDVSASLAAAMQVAAEDLFNLTITWAPPTGSAVTERITNVTVDPNAGPVRLGRALAASSRFVSCGELPSVADMRRLLAKLPPVGSAATWPGFNGGLDGFYLSDPRFYTSPELEARREGLYALERAGLFNLLVVPRDEWGRAPALSYPKILAYVARKRAFWILEAPPTDWDAAITSGSPVDDLINETFLNPGESGRYAAVFYPDVLQPDAAGVSRVAGPGGIIAGVFARSDTAKGVWKAPAGTDASLVGVSGPTIPLSDAQNGAANQVGINCIRSFPQFGTVVWGARTLRGADALDDDFRYIPTRRRANLIELSVVRGLQWAVFEPNDERLWSAIRLNVGSFLGGLFAQGAFAGATEKDAYCVACDASTTTPTDVQDGVCNVVVGFAPVFPAEFVVLYLQVATASVSCGGGNGAPHIIR